MTPPEDRFNEDAVTEALRLLHEPGEVFEVRILNTQRAGTVSGYFDAPDLAARAVARWDGKAPGVYATLNPVLPDLAARAYNRLVERVRTTTSDGDVTRRRWLLVDVDAERPAGISATGDEWQAANDLAVVIGAHLHAQGWPAPVTANSGNGMHLLYRVDLPNDDEARELVSRCLVSLAARFNTGAVKVDTAVFNAARIAKVPGTFVCKGDNLPARPHRRAALLATPAELVPVPVALLRALAGQAPAQAKPAPSTTTGARYGERFDVPGYMARHGLESNKHKQEGGADLWGLESCPFNSEHLPNDAWIRQAADGTVSAGCFHESCFSTWAELRERLEPGYRQAAPAPTTKPRSTAAVADLEEPAGAELEPGEEAHHAPPAPMPPVYPLTDPDGAPDARLAALWTAEAEAARAARLAGRPRGPVTGFPQLDKELGGYLRPGLHFVHGEPGTGKTNLVLQVAAQCGTPALLVSCEMPPLVLARRIVAHATNTYQHKLEDGELTPDASAALYAQAARACPMLAIMDATTTYPTPAMIQAAAEEWRAAHLPADGKPAPAGQFLVILDSLHTWAGARPAEGSKEPSEYESLNHALSRLLALSAALAAPVLVVAERNRPSMKDAGQSAAKGTARIEYSAESILSLNRVLEEGKWKHDADRYLDGDGAWREAAGEYHLRAELAKNRNGRTGHAVEMRFNGAVARIREA